MSESQRKSPIGTALVVVLLVAGGWAFMRYFEIEGLDQIDVRPKAAGQPPATDDRLSKLLASDRPWASGTGAQDALFRHPDGGSTPSTGFASHTTPPRGDAGAAVPGGKEAIDIAGEVTAAAKVSRPIRVGSWALAGFGPAKLAKPHVADLFSRLVRQFDVIALQQITSPERDLLPRMIEHVNRTGRKYDYLLGPTVGPAGGNATLGEQYAFLFDTERIETDRGQLYTVADPGQQLSYDPLVGWFRVRGMPPGEAWTFTLVNFRVDTTRAAQELPLLAQLMAAVAADGRGEDDLLLAGMLQADDRQLVAGLGGEASEAVVRATPTDIFARYQLSNLILPRRTTTEYLGRGGVIDFLRLYNMTSAEAEELSPHLPVFGEFTPGEGR